MLVDSHCHLDFPDFKDELDDVVARAKAVGIGRMVTISTRVRRQAGLLAIAERFPDVFCSVGTHPHHAHEELDIGAADLIQHARHPKVVAIGLAGGLDMGTEPLLLRVARRVVVMVVEPGLPDRHNLWMPAALN